MQRKYQLVIVGGGAEGQALATEALRLGIQTALVAASSTPALPPKAAVQTLKTQGLTALGTVHQKLSSRYNPERLRALGIDLYFGREIPAAKKIILAPETIPFVPQIPWMEQIEPITTDNLWNLSQLPKHLVIWGGGAAGCELAQAFAQWGTEVILLEKEAQLLPEEDWDVSQLFKNRLEQQGIKVLTHAEVLRVQKIGKQLQLEIREHDQDKTLETERLCTALGRRPIQNNPAPKTTPPICHDVSQARSLIHNTFFPFSKKPDELPKHRVVLTDPEMIRLGFSETEAKAKKIDYDILTHPLSLLDRAICTGQERGFIKVLTPKHSDQILGITAVGPAVSEWCHEWRLVMRHKLGFKNLAHFQEHPVHFSEQKEKILQWLWKALP